MRSRVLFLFVLLVSAPVRGNAVDLLARDPTKLTEGDPNRARAWEFTEADLFRVSRFSLTVGSDLRVELGPADLGVGHCEDGAVWAVLIPRERGTLTAQASSTNEAIAHVWLRFHPREVNRVFPPNTVSPVPQPTCS